MKARMKVRTKKTIKICIAVVVAAGLCFGGFLVYRKYTGTSTETTTSYSIVTIGTGDLEQNVVGTGTITNPDKQSVTADFDMELDSISVKAGQSVSAGDVLATIDADSLNDAITALETQLTTLDSQIGNLTRSYSSTSKLTSPSAGRVKLLYAAEGGNAEDIIAANGSLMVLSLDGYMRVELTTDQLAAGDEVTVVDGDDEFDGTVMSVTDGTAVILFSDESTDVDATVEILLDDVSLGTGTATIDLPLAITDGEGVIDTLYVDVDDSVSKNGSLMYLTDIAPSEEYQTAVEQRAEVYEQINEAKALLAAGQIVAPCDGIVNAISASVGQPVSAGSEICNLYTQASIQMSISVDELDIDTISVGQEASIVMDAFSDVTYEAVVSSISQIGTSNSGVTNYTVTLDVTGDDNLKIGMNGTATITVQKSEGVVEVPILALQSSGDSQYVWLYSETETSDSGVPGVRTEVTTGLSNDEYAEVTSGLSEGDKVVIVRSGSSSTDMSGMFSGMGEMGGMSDVGGDMGDRTMPSGDQGGTAPQMPSN